MSESKVVPGYWVYSPFKGTDIYVPDGTSIPSPDGMNRVSRIYTFLVTLERTNLTKEWYLSRCDPRDGKLFWNPPASESNRTNSLMPTYNIVNGPNYWIYSPFEGMNIRVPKGKHMPAPDGVNYVSEGCVQKEPSHLSKANYQNMCEYRDGAWNLIDRNRYGEQYSYCNRPFTYRDRTYDPPEGQMG